MSKLGTITLALVVNPSVPASTAQELIAYAKANPGELTFGSGSSSSRIAGEMLKSLAGIDMVNVPYKSNPQAVTDLLGGQISLVFADISTTLPQAKAGKVKALAVSSAERSPLAPDLPTMAEAGVPGYDLTAWFAAFVPAGTPKPIVDKLNAAFKAALADRGCGEDPARRRHRARHPARPRSSRPSSSPRPRSGPRSSRRRASSLSEDGSDRYRGRWRWWSEAGMNELASPFFCELVSARHAEQAHNGTRAGFSRG